MNRVQFWLLLLLGVILFGAVAFWLFDRPSIPALTDAAATPVADSPVQITDIARRRPNMLVIDGKAAPGTKLTLRLAGNKVGQSVAGTTGIFQLTTNPLPQGENLNFSLDYGEKPDVTLMVIDRRPQLIALMQTKGRTLPLQRPRTGSGILLAEWLDPPNNIHLVGQTDPGSTIYIYADNILVGKSMTTSKGIDSNLFEIALDESKFPVQNKQAAMRVDIYNANGVLTARSRLDFADGKAWQKIEETDGPPWYVWRDLQAQAYTETSTLPGQFVPVAAAK